METQASQTNFVQEILYLFTSIGRKLNIDFAPYIPLIQKAIKRNKLTFEAFDDQVEQITKTNPITLFYDNLVRSIQKEEEE